MSDKYFYRIGPAVILFAVMQFLISAPAYAVQAVAIGDLNFGIVGERELNDGYIVIPDVPVFWESDVPWRLTVSSLDPDLGNSSGAGNVKPLQDLLWRSGDEQSWQPVSQNIDEVAFGSQVGSGVIYLDVVVLLDWLKDSPGEYTLNLVFTIEPL